MDFDFSCLDFEDAGFAKSFTNASPAEIMPTLHAREFQTPEKEAEQIGNEIRSDGFNFKLAPGQGVSFLVKSVQTLTSFRVSIS